MCWLIESAKFRVEGYGSPESFLAAFDPARRGCLVLDIRMPHINGLDLQDRLNALSSQLPVIVLTGHGDVASCARAFKAGASIFSRSRLMARVSSSVFARRSTKRRHAGLADRRTPRLPGGSSG